MHTVLGLDLTRSTAFAALMPLEPGARPHLLAGASAPGTDPESDSAIVDAVSAALLRAAQLEGEQPESVVVVHPSSWDAPRVDRLRRALSAAGLRNVTLVDSALAAARTSNVPLQRGSVLAVVSLRPGGMDLVAFRTSDPGSFRPIGAPTVIETVPEEHLDHVLLGLASSRVDGTLPDVDERDPAVAFASRRLRRAVRAARRRLVDEDSAEIDVPVLGDAPAMTNVTVTVTRDEFEGACLAVVGLGLPVLSTAVTAAGADAILLTGTSAPAPMIAAFLREWARVPVVVQDPDVRGALGAARLAAAGEPRRAGMAGSPRRRPHRSLVFQLWPVAVALVALVVFAGAAGGGLTLTQAGETWAQPEITTSASSEPAPTKTAAPAVAPIVAAPQTQPSGAAAPITKRSRAALPKSGVDTSQPGSGTGPTPSSSPSESPTADPTPDPTTDPTPDPTTDPTTDPTPDPTTDPAPDPPTEPVDP